VGFYLIEDLVSSNRKFSKREEYDFSFSGSPSIRKSIPPPCSFRIGRDSECSILFRGWRESIPAREFPYLNLLDFGPAMYIGNGVTRLCSLVLPMRSAGTLACFSSVHIV
jgi:hypothetical protein